MFGKRILSCILTLAIVLSLGTVAASAATVEDTIVPYFTNISSIKNTFVIVNGTAIVETTYSDNTGAFSSITVEVTLQRKGLIFWSDVDGGEWSTTRTTAPGTISNSLALTKTGEYRAVITCTVYGTGGSPDTVTETLYYEYE